MSLTIEEADWLNDVLSGKDSLLDNIKIVADCPEKFRDTQQFAFLCGNLDHCLRQAVANNDTELRSIPPELQARMYDSFNSIPDIDTLDNENCHLTPDEVTWLNKVQNTNGTLKSTVDIVISCPESYHETLQYAFICGCLDMHLRDAVTANSEELRSISPETFCLILDAMQRIPSFEQLEDNDQGMRPDLS